MRFAPLIFLFVGLLIFPPALGAVTKYCPQKPATPESYTWNFVGEASELFDEVRREAREVEDRAGTLQALARNQQIRWESHALELSQVREDINRLGEMLCRLRTIQRVTEPWQQRAINRIAAKVTAPADKTEAAIGFLTDNRGRLFQPEYAGYFDDMYEDAGWLRDAAREFVEYAEASSRIERLENDAELSSVFTAS